MSGESAASLAVDVGRRLKRIRLEKGWSQRQLGLGLGVTLQQIQKYEKGVNAIPLHKLLKLASLFGIAPESLWQTPTKPRLVKSELDDNERGLREIVQAYRNIDDAQVRARLLKLMKQLAEDRPAFTS